MRIETKNSIVRRKVGSLEIARAYLIFDDEQKESNILITKVDKNAIVLRNFSNESTLCILGMGKDEEVNVIGQVNNFDVINVDLCK